MKLILHNKKKMVLLNSNIYILTLINQCIHLSRIKRRGVSTLLSGLKKNDYKSVKFLCIKIYPLCRNYIRKFTFTYIY